MQLDLTLVGSLKHIGRYYVMQRMLVLTFPRIPWFLSYFGTLTPVGFILISTGYYYKPIIYSTMINPPPNVGLAWYQGLL